MKQTTSELFSKHMSRKEFLQLAGLAVLTVLGVNNFVTMMKSHTQNHATTQHDASRGFGSSKFGI